MLLLAFVYLAIALGCIRQWGSTDPWQRLDVPVVGFFVLALLMTWNVSRLFRRLPPEKLREFAGLHFDPLTERIGGALTLLEISVFLDYGQWRLAPFLEWDLARNLGIALFGLAVLTWLWVDRHLLEAFLSPELRLIRSGPFRHVRHPRYTALLAYKSGVALIFASALGWLFVVVWALVLVRRVRMEERFLEETFGEEYRQYAAETARVLPGIL